jgi:hypothetical protein
VIYNMQIVAILYIPEYLSFMVYPTWAVPWCWEHQKYFNSSYHASYAPSDKT